MNFTNASTSDVHICVKVCTWCFPHKMHHAFTNPLHYSLFYRYNLFIWGGGGYLKEGALMYLLLKLHDNFLYWKKQRLRIVLTISKPIILNVF